MSLILANAPVQLPEAWNQVDWKTAILQVETLRGEAFACSKSGNLVKLRDAQRRILDP